LKRLGEILLDRGVLEMGELHTALEGCRRDGGRLGTHLLRLGYVDERPLLEALSEQLGVPYVPSTMLEPRSADLRTTVPMELQARAFAVPFSKTSRSLDVAMVNPNDAEAMDELASVSGLRINPYVATETAIRAAVGEPPTTVDEHDLRRPGGARPDFAGWEALWSPSRVEPSTLASVPKVLSARRGLSIASFPELKPILGGVGQTAETALETLEGLSEQLQWVRHRDDVGRLFVEFAGTLFERAVVVAVHKEAANGWLGVGEGLALEDVQSLVLPIAETHVLHNLMVSGGQRYVGPLGENEAALQSVLRIGATEAVAVVPVRVRDRAVMFVFGAGQVTAGSVAQAVSAAKMCGLAFEILILRNKLRAQAYALADTDEAQYD
jgi:hypothetical protein